MKRPCFGLALLLTLIGKVRAQDTFPSAPSLHYSPLIAQSDRAWQDFVYHYWDPTTNPPRLRPTQSDGTVRNDAAYPVFWQMSEGNNVLFCRWKSTGSEAAREMIRSQFEEIRARYGEARLSSAAWTGYRPDGIIYSEDDASWAITYFCQVHEATGDPAALRIAEALINSTYTTFADPNHGGSGVLYALPGEDRDHQGLSSGHEAVAARGALYVFEQTAHGNLLAYAKGTWDWMHRYLKHPSGVYFAELDIRPSVGGKPNPSYRKPIGWNRPNDITRGGSVAFLGGTMAMASLSGALYLHTGDKAYLDEVNSIVAGMQRRDTFARPGSAVGVKGDVFVNERDAWANGFTAPRFVWDALSLNGVDADGKLKELFLGTARAIESERTTEGFYGGDWSGAEWDAAHRWNTWVAQAKGGTGSGAGMATPDQLPTTSSSIAMIFAGAIVEGWRFPRLATAPGPLRSAKNALPNQIFVSKGI